MDLSKIVPQGSIPKKGSLGFIFGVMVLTVKNWGPKTILF